MSNGRGALWAVLALFGIVLAAGLTWSVMRFSGAHIGLASAPISVVHGLAPGPGATGPAQPEHDVTRTVTVTVSRTVTVPESTSGADRGPIASSSTTAVTSPSHAAPATTAPATKRTATSPIVLTPPTKTGSTSSRTDDGREDARNGSTTRRDD